MVGGLRTVLSLFVLSLVQLMGSEDFISHYEYGQMLYKQPRGVSCVECHGEDGRGKVIVEYRDEEGKKQVMGPDIRQQNLPQMIKALNDYHPVMPRYYLTDEEIEAIHDFIKEKQKREL